MRLSRFIGLLFRTSRVAVCVFTGTPRDYEPRGFRPSPTLFRFKDASPKISVGIFSGNFQSCKMYMNSIYFLCVPQEHTVWIKTEQPHSSSEKNIMEDENDDALQLLSEGIRKKFSFVFFPNENDLIELDSETKAGMNFEGQIPFSNSEVTEDSDEDTEGTDSETEVDSSSEETITLSDSEVTVESIECFEVSQTTQEHFCCCGKSVNSKCTGEDYRSTNTSREMSKFFVQRQDSSFPGNGMPRMKKMKCSPASTETIVE